RRRRSASMPLLHTAGGTCGLPGRRPHLPGGLAMLASSDFSEARRVGDASERAVQAPTRRESDRGAARARPLRIVHLITIPCSPDSSNGVAKAIYYLSTAQRALGHEVLVTKDLR